MPQIQLVAAEVARFDDEDAEPVVMYRGQVREVSDLWWDDLDEEFRMMFLFYEEDGGGGPGGPVDATDVEAEPSDGRPSFTVQGQLEDLEALLIPVSEKGAPSGVATLDSGGTVPDIQLGPTIVRASDLVTTVADAINDLIAGAPGALDTLNEIAAAINDDANFAATITAALGGKAAIDGSNVVAATWRTVLGLGTAAQSNVGAFDPAGSAAAAQAAAQAHAVQRANHTGTQSSDTLVDGTTSKSFLASERTKLAGIETGADVTDAGNVAAAGAVMDTTISVAGMGWVVDEDDMASDSPSKVPTQQSVAAFVSAAVAAGISDGDKGDVVVSVGGTVWNVQDGVITPAKLSFDPASQTELNNAIAALAVVATSGDYSDLIGTPTLGTAAASDIEDFDPAGTAADFYDSAIVRANHTGTQDADTIVDGTANKVFTAAEKTKLAGIASGATANSTDASLLDRANHTGTQSADTVVDGTTNKAFTAAEKTKLAGIEALADVTDAVNVAAAGAVMNTGAETIAGVKTFSSIPLIPDDVYNATSWNGSLGVATKNAIRDIIEMLAPKASPALTGTPTAPTAAQGTNTTQIATTAMVQSEVTLLAPKASPALTGNPTAPTQAPGTNNTRIATTEYTDAAIAALVGTAPGVLNTLGEISDAINDDANLYTTLTTAIDAKVAQTITNGVTSSAPSQDAVFDALALKANAANPVFTGTVTIPDGALAIADTNGLQTALDAKAALASPTFTGTPAAPTAAQGTNTTQVATTAMVQSEVALLLPKTDVIGTGLATTGAIAINLATLTGTKQAITLTGNPTFSVTNPAVGRWVTVIMKAGGSTRTLTWPAGWTQSLGAALPTSLASGKTAVFTVEYVFGTADTDAVVSYSVMP